MTEPQPVICPFCSLHCTDLRLKIDGGRLIELAPQCPTALDRFQSSLDGLQAFSEASPSIDTARSWLEAARQPLIILAGGTDCGSVSASIRLAERCSAILTCEEDISGSLLSLSMQPAGGLSGTLADLKTVEMVLFCGKAALNAAPRLLESLGISEAKVLHLDPADPWQAIRWLRLAMRDDTKAPPAEFSILAARLANVHSGLVLFGRDWLSLGQAFSTELHQWLRDLNRRSRWYGLYLPPHSNSLGISEALLAETGYPGSLRFKAGKADFSPSLWQAEGLIQQGQVDLCLLVGLPGSFSAETFACLDGMRTILVSPEPPAWQPSLWLPCAQTGLDAAGSVQRLDGLPLELSPILRSARPVMVNLLQQLAGEDRQ